MQTAGIPVTVQKPILSVPVLASHPDIAQNPVILEVSLTKDLFRSQSLLRKIVLDRAEWQNVLFDLGTYTGEDVLLVFEVNRTWNPQKESGTLDPRDLGIAVGTLMFEEDVRSQNRVANEPVDPEWIFEQKDWQGRQKESLRRTGKSWIDMNLPPGRYLFKLWAQGQKAGAEWPYMVIWADDDMIGESWVASDLMGPYTFCRTLDRGARRFGAAFMNDYYERANMDRNLILGKLEIIKFD